MKNKFRIGITDDTDIMRCRLIVKLIEICGAIPVLIPMYLNQNILRDTSASYKELDKAIDAHLGKVDNILQSCDALIFPGNKRDINPGLYGVSQIHPETKRRLPQNKLNVRQETEIKMLQYALKKKDIPVLGICGGMQLINAVLGGSLVQHLPDDPRIIGEDNPHHDKDLKDMTDDELQDFENNFEQIINGERKNGLYQGTHSMTVEENSLLAQIYKEQDSNVDLKNIKELSIHHQGCFAENISDKLKIVATSPDGIIEAVEHKNHPKMFLLTQFHPECNASGIALSLVKNLINSITS
jgi:putative glutamine amidotransferase